jgi:hypothetical protein
MTISGRWQAGNSVATGPRKMNPFQYRIVAIAALALTLGGCGGNENGAGLTAATAANSGSAETNNSSSPVAGTGDTDCPI